MAICNWGRALTMGGGVPDERLVTSVPVRVGGSDAHLVGPSGWQHGGPRRVPYNDRRSSECVDCVSVREKEGVPLLGMEV